MADSERTVLFYYGKGIVTFSSLKIFFCNKIKGLDMSYNIR